MKKAFPILLIVLGISAFSSAAEIAVIRTVDGLRMEGELLNFGDVLEWRKDIYEMTGPSGRNERFFLKPGLTGRIRISEIREIRRIQPGSAPEDIVTLSNDQKARLLLNYLLILANGKYLYISDFITLEHFFLEIRSSEGSRRIYLSKLESMTLKQGNREPVSRQSEEIRMKPAPVTETEEPKPVMDQVTYRTQFEFISEKSANHGILIFFGGLSALLACILVLILVSRSVKTRKPAGSKPLKKHRKSRQNGARKMRKPGKKRKN